MNLNPFIVSTVTIVIAGLFSTASAVADEITVAANRSSKIDLVYFSTKDDCLISGKPETYVPQQPSHGSISFQWVAAKFPKDAGGCAGKPIKGTQVVYTPNKGFHGKDHISVGFRYPTYIDSPEKRSYTTDYDIIVK